MRTSTIPSSPILFSLTSKHGQICLPNSVNRRPNRPRPINFPFNNSTRNINRGRSPISLKPDNTQPKNGNNSSFNSRRRLPRGLSLREFIQGFRMFISGDVVGLFNSTGLLTGLGESGSFIDTAIIQLAKIYGINIKSSDDLIPALFLKGFADITGCRFWVSLAFKWISCIGSHIEKYHILNGMCLLYCTLGSIRT
ncbi:uncharacterized protein LOC107363017 isoform X2 [Tetranychus urticae]|uniref:uncharacterized protein LOC107363017 isoform X2 n=1 Tax=Tetranychus urticae TaxID=32264 RepID=UPI00077B8D08|nr:uncharacterized protein LOC107363017 isoform X2 [Tetranychus urticae]